MGLVFGPLKALKSEVFDAAATEERSAISEALGADDWFPILVVVVVKLVVRVAKQR